MKKFVKLSLAAAVATAGLTTVNAASLEESIKNIEVSGAARLRHQQSNETTDDYNKTGYIVNVASKVSDDVTMTVSFGAKSTEIDGNEGVESTANGSLDFTGFTATYTGIANTTAILGRQALSTPWTVASDLTGADHTGTGLLVVNTATPVTLIGAYMNSTEFTDNSMTVLGAKASIANINVEGWYADSDKQLDSFFLKASTKLEVEGIKLGLAAQHIETEYEGATNTNKVTQYTLNAGMGIFSAQARFLINGGENNKNVAYDNTAKSQGFEGVLVHGSSNVADRDATRLSIAAKVNPALTLSLTHDQISAPGNGNDDSETRFQTTWAMAKGVKLTGILGQAEIANEDVDLGRIQLDYKF